MDLDRLIAAVRRRWWVVCATALVCAGLAVGGTALAPAEYTATARGFVSVGSPSTRSPNVLTSGSLYILARMSSYARLGTSSQVLDGVRSSLGLSTPVVDLREEVVSSAVVDTAFVEVRVTDADPVVAQRVADATVSALGQVVEGLENGTVDVTLSSPALLPTSPSNRAYVVDGGVALVAGAVLGAFGAVASDARRRRASATP